MINTIQQYTALGIVMDALSDLSMARKILGERTGLSNLAGQGAIARAEGGLLVVQELLGGPGAHDSLRIARQCPGRDLGKLGEVRKAS